MSRTMKYPLWALLLNLAVLQAGVSAEVGISDDPSLLWGPYRPNVYFGIRPRLPESLLLGLMWTKTENNGFVESDLRHSCDSSDGITGYGWETYDPRTGGQQIIHDTGNFIDLKTEFFKLSTKDTVQQWGVRVSSSPVPETPNDVGWLVAFYIGTEERNPEDGAFLTCSKAEDNNVVDCHGNQRHLQNYTLQIRGLQNGAGKPQQGNQTLIRSDDVPPDGIWQAKTIYMSHVHSGTEQYGEGTLYFVQTTYSELFQKLEIVFSSNGSTDPIPSDVLSSGLEESKTEFLTRFKDVFTPKPPFGGTAHKAFLQAMLSNLLGGLGYFYGDSMADLSHPSEYDEKDENFWEKVQEARSKTGPTTISPKGLFSMVPSRSASPRGFLWDEGFHLLVVIEWDLDLAMDIVQSWLSLIDDEGWIAREQILGSEARSRVPPEFRVQYPQHANPPTLSMVGSAFAEFVSGNKTYSGHASRYLNDPQLGVDLLRFIYPLLQRHYDWFRKSQSGDLESYTRPEHAANEAYRWRGRYPGHTLASGLDDYPRAEPPHPGELHVDAMSWVGFMAKSLRQISDFLGEEKDAALYSRHKEAIERNLNALHWCNENQAYCDATISNNSHTLICHKGYVSLSPFLVGLLEPTDLHVKLILDLIRDEKELWSSFGIRSLSIQDEYYGTDENYWRSPVWINVNFLILVQLLNVAQTQGPFQRQAREMYIALRRHIVATVYNVWRQTGYAWEHYNPDTGAGQGVQHFTGWTALVVKIVSMPSLESRGMLRLMGSDEDGTNWSLLFSTATVVVFVIVFRRYLAKLWRSTLRR